jgi:hypothetical protein
MMPGDAFWRILEEQVGSVPLTSRTAGEGAPCGDVLFPHIAIVVLSSGSSLRTR